MDKPELDQGDGTAPLMVALLDSWGVDAAGQGQRLALPAGTRAHFCRLAPECTP
jgi:hypothetical protein